jgi:hypothetical protein
MSGTLEERWANLGPYGYNFTPVKGLPFLATKFRKKIYAPVWLRRVLDFCVRSPRKYWVQVDRVWCMPWPVEADPGP